MRELELVQGRTCNFGVSARTEVRGSPGGDELVSRIS